jgi:hypothetical protein
MKLLWLFLLAGHLGLAQTPENTPTPGEYEGVSGNPFLLKDWSEGIIRFSSGKVTDKFKLKFNVAQNRLVLQFQGSSFAAESKITEFIIYSRNKKDSFLFRKGFPDADRGNKETFYRVLEEGPVTLLMLPAKDILQEKDMLATKPSRHFQDVELFYILKEGKMYKIDNEVALVSEILSDRREQLKKYISDQQLRMRSGEDFLKVVRKYNELQKSLG